MLGLEMSRDIRDASRENLLSRDIFSRENFVSRRNLENLARSSRRFCKKRGKINLKRILCIHDCLPSYLYHFLTTKDLNFQNFLFVCMFICILGSQSIRVRIARPRCRSIDLDELSCKILFLEFCQGILAYFRA